MKKPIGAKRHTHWYFKLAVKGRSKFLPVRFAKLRSRNVSLFFVSFKSSIIYYFKILDLKTNDFVFMFSYESSISHFLYFVMHDNYIRSINRVYFLWIQNTKLRFRLLFSGLQIKSLNITFLFLNLFS